jgi:predicted RNA binding protein YcfA (HicA-like mRNA interferase family)
MKYGDLFRILRRNGWLDVRQSGSHVILRHPGKPQQLVVPRLAGKEVTKGLLQAILRQAGIKVNQR